LRIRIRPYQFQFPQEGLIQIKSSNWPDHEKVIRLNANSSSGDPNRLNIAILAYGPINIHLHYSFFVQVKYPQQFIIITVFGFIIPAGSAENLAIVNISNFH
jgi:hypothetical protein